MNVLIIITVISFDVVAAMLFVNFLLKEEMPRSLQLVGVIAIIPAIICLAILISKVKKKTGESWSKYELIQEPVYRKIK